MPQRNRISRWDYEKAFEVYLRVNKVRLFRWPIDQVGEEQEIVK